MGRSSSESDPRVKRSLSEALTKSSWFTLSEGAMPHKLANMFREKLHHPSGRWSFLFVQSLALWQSASKSDLKQRRLKMKHLRYFIIITLSCFVIVTLTLSPSRAATFTVDSTADTADANPGNGICADGSGNCTLRAATEESNALAGADTINFSVTGTITLGSQLPTVLEALDVNGPGAGTLSVDANGTGRVFTFDSINNQQTFSIYGLTLTGGVVTGSGGAIWLDQGDTLNVSVCTISGNSATSHGGGIINLSGSTLILSSVTVTGNSADYRSGGIAVSGTGTFTNILVSGNSAPNGGGIGNSGTLTLSNSTISSNLVSTSGGGITNTGTFTLENVTLSDNTANNSGGGIYINAGDVTLNDVTFSGNTANSVGGGIGNAGTLVITNSIFTDNEAGWGGGIWNFNPATLTNVTLSSNTASNGGGIYNAGTLTITNCTIAYNVATATGGGIENTAAGSTTLRNTIVSNNVSGGNCNGAITSEGCNLEDADSCSFQQTGDLFNTDPLLGTLQDNGGPTYTHALQSGSPAIDAGNNASSPATDQRGIARPQDGNGDGVAVCDIGAFEVPGTTAGAGEGGGGGCFIATVALNE